MSVVSTQKLLYKITESCQQQPKNQLAELQSEIIATPLMKLFPEASPEAIHYELLRNGLFEPIEWVHLNKIVQQLEENNVWQVVKKEYKRLKKLWNGPKVEIYIYPLTKKRPKIGGIKANKNGVAYNEALFLFISNELVKEELAALFAHEYHHICRLLYLKKSPFDMQLKDSVVIEGMAECAVKEIYGEKWLSPWAKRYSQKEALAIWEKHFVPALHIKGVNNHHSFLYGAKTKGLPLWAGYCIGYYIVQSYLQNNGPIEQSDLYKMPTDEIIAGSDYHVK